MKQKPYRRWTIADIDSLGRAAAAGHDAFAVMALLGPSYGEVITKAEKLGLTLKRSNYAADPDGDGWNTGKPWSEWEIQDLKDVARNDLKSIAVFLQR